jgi:hypothetical protein
LKNGGEDESDYPAENHYHRSIADHVEFFAWENAEIESEE